MFCARLTLIALFAGLLPADAQEPRLWRDPDQGCTYIITSQGGIGLRYRRDGSPDCPDWLEAARIPDVVPGPAVAPRMVPVTAAIWPGTPRAGAPSTRPGIAGGSRPPLVWPGDSPSEPARTRDAALVRPQNFGCWAAAESRRGGTPAQVRVRVEPQARVILVDSTGGREVARYTLDSSGDVWFNGRNERDPRLGIILSPSRGHMWLDISARSGLRADITSQPFDCRPEGTAY